MRSTFGCFAALLIAVVIAVPVIGHFAWSNTRTTMTCTVEEKDRTAKYKGGSDQRLYTEECGVLSVGDDWLNGQWNSSDTYAQIDVGKTYIFGTVGWRNGFFSQFPNVISVVEVQP